MGEDMYGRLITEAAGQRGTIEPGTGLPVRIGIGIEVSIRNPGMYRGTESFYDDISRIMKIQRQIYIRDINIQHELEASS